MVQEEKETMDRLIAYGALTWIKVFGKNKVVVKNAIVDEENQDVEMIGVDLKTVEPLSIEQLASQYKNFK